jgi:hypothetical protein
MNCRSTTNCGGLATPTKRRETTDLSASSSSSSSSPLLYGLLTVTVLVLQFHNIHADADADAEQDYYSYYSYNDDNRDVEEIEAYEQRLHDIIVEDWYDLVRYLVGLGFAIFGLIGLYFHQFASYYFLKRYTYTEGTVRKSGLVLSIESMNNVPRYPLSSATVSEDNNYDDMEEAYDDEGMVERGKVQPKHDSVPSYSTAYRIFVVYSAEAVHRNSLCAACGPNINSIISPEPLVETDYFQWFRTSQSFEVGSKVPLILLRDNPKSACTPELLDSHMMNAFNRKNCQAITLLGLSLILAIVVLILASVFEILSMPHPETQRPIGWSILIIFSFLFVISGYVFCKMLFEHFKQKVFLSAIPAPTVVKRNRDDSETITGTRYRRPEDVMVFEVADNKPSELGHQWKLVESNQRISHPTELVESNAGDAHTNGEGS